MAKKKRIKKNVIIIAGVIMFFTVYISVYKYFSKQQAPDTVTTTENISTEKDRKSVV